MKKYARNLGWAAALLAACGFAAPASAASVLTYKLTETAVSGYTAPFGTVTVSQLTGGVLSFDVELAGSYTFHNNPNHDSFAFSLVDHPALTVSSLSSGFVYLGNKGYKEAGFSGSSDSWGYAFNCTSCTKKTMGPTSLSFTITNSAHDLVLADLLSWIPDYGKPVYMVADLRNSNGLTGNVGATAVSAAPEPAVWAMLLVGFGLTGVALRSRRRVFAA